MSDLRYGSLCSGYSGLDMGIQSVLGGETVWFVEYDKAPSKILEHHWPDVPNYGDLTTLDWAKLAPIDVLTAGYPCQPFSHAGERLGVLDERHIWPHIAAGVAILRPHLLVFENVRGHLSLGYDEVLRDLQQLGYDVRWVTLRAADVGAAHGRARLFIFAEDTRNERPLRSRSDRRGGVHRDSVVRRIVPGAPQGVHVGQGAPGAAGIGGPVWREGWARPGRDGGSSSDSDVADHRRVGLRGDREAAAHAAREGSSCGCGAGVPRPTSVAGAIPPAWADLDARGAGAGGDAAGADSGSEPQGAGPGTPGPAGAEADGDLPLGLVVGAGGRPVRPGGVSGPAAYVGPDGGGACVCTAQPLHELTLLPTPAVNQRGSSGDLMLPSAVNLLPTPRVTTGGSIASQVRVRDVLEGRAKVTEDCRLELTAEVLAHRDQSWGDYAPAIARWEHATGRTAPAPTEPGKNGNPRLSPIFVEWLMGLPEGHITDPAIGLTRNEQLKAAGNGVVPAQAAAATRWWLTQITNGVAA